jgi:hypothetical protein
VERLSRSELSLPDPACFDVLREVLALLATLARDGDVAAYSESLHRRGEGAVSRIVATPEILATLRRSCAEARTVPDRTLRLHVWFDAFRTMKLMHALRDGGHPDLPWQEATRRAEFVPTGRADLVDLVDLVHVQDVVVSLRAEERRAPPVVGPTVAAQKGR